MPEESKLKDSCIARHHIYKGTLNLYTYVFLCVVHFQNRSFVSFIIYVVLSQARAAMIQQSCPNDS